MKTLVMNEKSWRNQGDVHTKLLKSHLLIALEYHSNAKTKYFYIMVGNERNLI